MSPLSQRYKTLHSLLILPSGEVVCVQLMNFCVGFLVLSLGSVDEFLRFFVLSLGSVDEFLCWFSCNFFF